MTKQEKIEAFNPDGVGLTNANVFGLPFNYTDSEVIIVPVPWDVTVSYLAGTANGPQAVFDYSSQIDLFDFDFKDAWKAGFYMQAINKEIADTNAYLRNKAVEYIQFLEEGGKLEDSVLMTMINSEINRECGKLCGYVYNQSLKILEDNKTPVIIGGEHAVPLGAMQALNKQYNNWGVLQIDAHADLRPAYEGLTYSHASIMYNALETCNNLTKIVSVGVRDLCNQEYNLGEENDKIHPFYWNEIVKNRFNYNKTQVDWSIQCELIIEQLPEMVYISFDIDGLQPELCPNTGTPVAGGLTMNEAFHLISKLVNSGRTIIGADLCEVSNGENNNEFNANVGARVLYKICGAIVESKKNKKR